MASDFEHTRAFLSQLDTLTERLRARRRPQDAQSSRAHALTAGDRKTLLRQLGKRQSFTSEAAP